MIKFEEKGDNFSDITIYNIDTSIANSIRKAMIAHVETLAIDIIKVKENDGLLLDPILGHRLGLIPLKCSELCNSGTFLLDVENKTNEMMTVYSEDLIPINSKTLEVLENPDFEVVDKKIVVTKLKPGQKIYLIAEAIKGTGYTHAKWSPLAGPSYELNEEKDKDGNKIFFYTFHVESLGSLTPKEIFMKALEFLKNKLEIIQEKI